MNMMCEGENIGRRKREGVSGMKGVSDMKYDYETCKKICKKIFQGAIKKNVANNIPRCAHALGL